MGEGKAFSHFLYYLKFNPRLRLINLDSIIGGVRFVLKIKILIFLNYSFILITGESDDKS